MRRTELATAILLLGAAWPAGGDDRGPDGVPYATGTMVEVTAAAERDAEIRASMAELAAALEAAGARPATSATSAAAEAELRRGPERLITVAAIEVEGRTWSPMEVAITRTGRFPYVIARAIETDSRGPRQVEKRSLGRAGPDGRTDLHQVRSFLEKNPDAHVRLVVRPPDG